MALLQLIGRLYDAAVHPELWQPWFEDLCRELCAPSGALILHFQPGVGHRSHLQVGIREELGLRYVSFMAEDQNLFAKAITLPAGEFMNLTELIPEAEFLRSRFYTEWMRPQDLRHLLLGMIDRSESHTSGFGFLRRHGARPFGNQEVDLLARLAPHMQRAVHVQEIVAAADLKARATERALDALLVGAALVDADGGVLATNRRAEALLERKEGLWLECGHLRAERSEDTATLRRLISDATSGIGGGPERGGVLALSRVGVEHPFVAFVTPVRPAVVGVPWLKQGAALVLISDPEELPQLAEPGLCRLYGLTPAEARVAARIAQAKSIEEIASELGVKVSTVRAQLRQVLAKTDTRRQAELVRLLLTGPGMLEDT